MAASKLVRGQSIAPQKLIRAKELRHKMTPEEKTLWEHLRRDELGVHFRRQQIIAGFIVDFYCDAAGLVVELDGTVHDASEQRAIDAKRDAALRDLGLRVVRIKNRAVSADLPQVLQRIKRLARPRWG